MKLDIMIFLIWDTSMYMHIKISLILATKAVVKGQGEGGGGVKMLETEAFVALHTHPLDMRRSATERDRA